jgi:hypothetical protein
MQRYSIILSAYQARLWSGVNVEFEGLDERGIVVFGRSHARTEVITPLDGGAAKVEAFAERVEPRTPERSQVRYSIFTEADANTIQTGPGGSRLLVPFIPR